jgi:isoleucyl-tRNA synthetase
MRARGARSGCRPTADAPLRAAPRSYPFCWRSHTPLIYKAVPSYFIKVEALKARLLVANDATRWVPAYVRERRFRNWLEGAHDWAVSRNRFWGTPLPVWRSPDGEEEVVIGSVEELYERSGVRVTDLHRHFVDDITIPSARGPAHAPLRRVEDVFDCWFESGSMPYAHIHYPFENKAFFEGNFPADFVAEGLDQTRGWFYTLMVLSTALFDKPAFKNLVCNGLVLAADGKKMSKSLKNYPAPDGIIAEFGADALRLYLVNSPVVRAEPLRFQREGVFGVVKDVFLKWYNAYRFLVQNARRAAAEAPGGWSPHAVDLGQASNVLDRWIAVAARGLVAYVREEMGAYRLYTVAPRLVRFIDALCNTYVRLNRGRLKGRGGPEDAAMALATLYDVLRTLCVLMAPFTPFFTESMFQNLRRAAPAEGPRAEPASVHFCEFPGAGGERSAADERIERSVGRMSQVIELARTIRERHTRAIKTPLRCAAGAALWALRRGSHAACALTRRATPTPPRSRLTVVHPDADFLGDISGELAWCAAQRSAAPAHSVACALRPRTAAASADSPPRRSYVTEEVNVLELAVCADVSRYASVRAEPNWTALGKRLGKAMGAVAAAVKALTPAQLAAYEAGGTLAVAGAELGPGDLVVIREFRKPADAPECDAAGDGDVLVVLELAVDGALAAQGLAREAVARVQRARKAAGVSAGDAVRVRLGAADAALRDALAQHAAYLAEALGGAPAVADDADAAAAAAAALAAEGDAPGAAVLLQESAELSSGAELLITLCGALQRTAL